VKDGSEAFKAGLRDGQTVLRSTAIDPNDSDHAIEMTVLESGMPKRVRYLPHGAQYEVDQYEIQPEWNTHQCPNTVLR